MSNSAGRLGREEEEEIIKQNRGKCESILAISPKIRYAGIMNRFGRTIAGRLRKGTVPLLKPDEARNEYFIEATRNQLRRNFESSIGKTEYTFTENEKVKIVTMLNENNFYYITMDKDTAENDVIRIIQSIKTEIKNNN